MKFISGWVATFCFLTFCSLARAESRSQVVTILNSHKFVSVKGDGVACSRKRAKNKKFVYSFGKIVRTSGSGKVRFFLASGKLAKKIRKKRIAYQKLCKRNFSKKNSYIDLSIPSISSIRLVDEEGAQIGGHSYSPGDPAVIDRGNFPELFNIEVIPESSVHSIIISLNGNVISRDTSRPFYLSATTLSLANVSALQDVTFPFSVQAVAASGATSQHYIFDLLIRAGETDGPSGILPTPTPLPEPTPIQTPDPSITFQGSSSGNIASFAFEKMSSAQAVAQMLLPASVAQSNLLLQGQRTLLVQFDDQPNNAIEAQVDPWAYSGKTVNDRFGNPTNLPSQYRLSFPVSSSSRVARSGNIFLVDPASLPTLNPSFVFTQRSQDFWQNGVLSLRAVDEAGRLYTASVNLRDLETRASGPFLQEKAFYMRLFSASSPIPNGPAMYGSVVLGSNEDSATIYSVLATPDFDNGHGNFFTPNIELSVSGVSVVSGVVGSKAKYQTRAGGEEQFYYFGNSGAANKLNLLPELPSQASGVHDLHGLSADRSTVLGPIHIKFTNTALNVFNSNPEINPFAMVLTDNRIGRVANSSNSWGNFEELPYLFENNYQYFSQATIDENAEYYFGDLPKTTFSHRSVRHCVDPLGGPSYMFDGGVMGENEAGGDGIFFVAPHTHLLTHAKQNSGDIVNASLAIGIATINRQRAKYTNRGNGRPIKVTDVIGDDGSSRIGNYSLYWGADELGAYHPDLNLRRSAAYDDRMTAIQNRTNCGGYLIGLTVNPSTGNYPSSGTVQGINANHMIRFTNATQAAQLIPHPGVRAALSSIGNVVRLGVGNPTSAFQTYLTELNDLLTRGIPTSNTRSKESLLVAMLGLLYDKEIYPQKYNFINTLVQVVVASIPSTGLFVYEYSGDARDFAANLIEEYKDTLQGLFGIVPYRVPDPQNPPPRCQVGNEVRNYIVHSTIYGPVAARIYTLLYKQLKDSDIAPQIQTLRDSALFPFAQSTFAYNVGLRAPDTQNPGPIGTGTWFRTIPWRSLTCDGSYYMTPTNVARSYGTYISNAEMDYLKMVSHYLAYSMFPSLEGHILPKISADWPNLGRVFSDLNASTAIFARQQREAETH